MAAGTRPRAGVTSGRLEHGEQRGPARRFGGWAAQRSAAQRSTAQSGGTQGWDAGSPGWDAARPDSGHRAHAAPATSRPPLSRRPPRRD